MYFKVVPISVREHTLYMSQCWMRQFPVGAGGGRAVQNHFSAGSITGAGNAARSLISIEIN